jgi:quercetin dioxygenase-like cupin family protein
MDIKHTKKLPLDPVSVPGVEGTKMQWIFGAADGVPGFAMRRFVMAPGGMIPLHGHHWEHEIYILRGTAEVFSDDSTTTVSAGDAIYVGPDEQHGYRNQGTEDLEFLCMVPLSAT